MASSKSLILTGASRGIGLAIAEFLLKESHCLFLVARTKEPLEKLKKEFPGQVEFLVGDLKDFQLGPKVIDLAIKAFSKIDGLILNHGTLTPVKRIADSTPEEWRTVFDINFFSCIAFLTPAIPHLRKTKGKVILTSSGAATGAYATWGSYGSSKAAMNHLTLTLSVEEPDITAVAIRPGVVDTDMQADVRRNHLVMDETDVKKFKGLHEEGKLLRPEQPGNIIARLVVGADKGLSGSFLTWNDKVLEKYQDS